MNIAIITGASSGLGVEFLKEISAVYPSLDEIWLVARREDRLIELAAQYTKPVCVPVALDLTSDSAYEALKAKLEEKQANVSILVNNAGMGKMGNVADMDFASQTMMVDLNCRGLTAVTSICLKFMSRGSQIINICSIASFCPNTRLNTYSATKAYVMSFTKGLREELKPLGINCMCVCPGPMKTEFLSVAAIEPGTSKTFDTLPYSDPNTVAKNTLKASAKGKCVYTHLFLFKLFRVLAKILPHNLVMKWCRV